MERVSCEVCGRKFDAKESLNQHFNAKHREQPKEIITQKKSYKRYIFYGSVIILLGLIVWVIIPDSFNPDAEYTPITSGGEHFKGDQNASIAMIEFSDFQCPFCAKFYRETYSQIDAEFIKTNKVKFVFKHFPLTQIHNFAFKAAEATECAADQGKFWEYHDILFERSPQLSKGDLKSYAEELGLDTGLFNNCLDSGVMAERVREDIEEATKTGVRSTPTFFIGEQKIEGAQPFSVFELALRR